MAALLLVGIAASLIVSLSNLGAWEALSVWLQLRGLLKAEVEQQEQDPCWQKDAKLIPDLYTWTLEELARYTCILMPHYIEPRVPEPLTGITHKDEILAPILMQGITEPPLGPLGRSLMEQREPTMARFPMRLRFWDIDHIADALTTLNDPDLSNTAAGYSPTFAPSIFQWMNLLVELQFQRVVENFPTTSVPYEPDSRTHILRNTSFADARRLAEYEPPNFAAVSEMARKYELLMPNAGLPIGVRSAGVFVEFALLFSVIHFWAFLQEARTSSAFPAQATIFSAFQRTATLRCMFSIMVLLPAFAALLLAWNDQPRPPASVAALLEKEYFRRASYPAYAWLCFTPAAIVAGLCCDVLRLWMSPPDRGYPTSKPSRLVRLRSRVFRKAESERP